ncbi:cytochrome P450 306a1-like isoform X2 [Daktulosphaira vitifoliae]|nr:cytochrome P450 306a1-like isoform X2 [Daktulosphaira vitifoliae]
MGKHLAVVLTDPLIVRSALAKNELSDRSNFEFIDEIMQQHGIIFSNGELWKEQRKFVINWLKTIGMKKVGEKKNNLQKMIIDTVKSVISEMRKSNDKPLSVKNLLLLYLGDFMNLIVLGKSWPVKHPTWTYLRDLATDGSKKFAIASPLSVLPFLRIIPKYKDAAADVLEGSRATHNIYQQLMNKRTDDDLDKYEDLISVYLKKIKEMKNYDQQHYFSTKQCTFLSADIFGAGVETTSDTLQWFLLYMALNKQIQNELHNQLTTVSRNCEIIDLEMIDDVPYLKACVYESMRLRPAAPAGIPRTVNKEVIISGYHIPKDTMIIPLIWGMHHNEKYWPNPSLYDPSRFIDSDGKIINNKAFMPFQAGQRTCVGKILAYWIVFLFGANIIHKFEVSLDSSLSEDEIETIMDGDYGITLEPGLHKLIFKPRQNI